MIDVKTATVNGVTVALPEPRSGKRYRVAEEAPVIPKVGDGATEFGWSDRRAYTVIKVSKSGKTAIIQRDRATLVPTYKPEFVPGGFSVVCLNNSEQSYTYLQDYDGDKVKVHLCKDNRWHIGGMRGARVKMGVRSEFYDYNF